MIFNSLSYAIFLPVVFALYWWVNHKVQQPLKWQNRLLLVASYFFYGCWDWRFLFLLMFSTLLDYFTGLMMCKTEVPRTRAFWFWLSVIVNLSFLGVFKYYNFFAESFANFIGAFGLTVHPATIQVILPVGISFYTFHGLSYVIDIYQRRIKAERNFVDYAVFVSFFPLLVAGPIERATHLLPQIKQKRIFEYSTAVDGLRQILWGLFKKVVIADNCAIFANLIFNSSAEGSGNLSGSTLVFGTLCFSIQIYCDFSGYSDIALGSARLFGINLLRNFAFPYFSRDIAEFWRRWHISLTTWFRDYLYIPLGGSRGGTWMKIRNTFIIFLVSGFWHGANWTFLVWGALNAACFIPLLLTRRNRDNMETVAQGKVFPSLRETSAMLLTFCLVTLGWIFFRAENLSHAWSYLSGMVSPSLLTIPRFGLITDQGNAVVTVLFVLFFLVIEWVGREQNHALERFGFGWPKVFRRGFYYSLIFAIFFFANSGQNFIYFQF